MSSCYNDDLYFCHIPKCGGTSVQAWLERHEGVTTEGLPNGHIPVRYVERFTGRPLRSFRRILAVIRHPFAQQWSQYTYWRGRGDDHPCDEMARHCSFGEFLRHPLSDYRQFISTAWQYRYGVGDLYHWWMADENGELPAHLEVVRCEDLDKRFPGIEWRNANYSDWRGQYTAEDAEIVRHRFRWTIPRYYPSIRSVSEVLAAKHRD